MSYRIKKISIPIYEFYHIMECFMINNIFIFINIYYKEDLIKSS